MTYYVYLLECFDGSIYTGITTDLARRFKEHLDQIGSKYTRSKKAKKILFAEQFLNRSEASKREAEIKGWPRERKMKLVLRGGLDLRLIQSYHSNVGLNDMKKKEDKLDVLASRLRSAGDPSRLRIMQVVLEHDLICVSDVAKKLKMSVAIVSHHMQALASEGLVAPERHGKRICYIPTKEDFVSDLKKLIGKTKLKGQR